MAESTFTNGSSTPKAFQRPWKISSIRHFWFGKASSSLISMMRGFLGYVRGYAADGSERIDLIFRCCADDALAPLEDGTEPDPIPNTAPKIQEVLQFDMDTWKVRAERSDLHSAEKCANNWACTTSMQDAIRLFNITKPMIPARGPVNTQKDSWAV